MTEEAGEHRGHLWQGEKILDSPACKGFLRIHLWMENNKNVLCIHVVQEILRPYYLRIYLWMGFQRCSPSPLPPCASSLTLRLIAVNGTMSATSNTFLYYLLTNSQNIHFIFLYLYLYCQQLRTGVFLK